MAKRGAGGQQHLKDAKEGLLEREGAGIGEKRRMPQTTELLVSKESKDEHENGERASKISLVLRRRHVAVAVIVCSSSPCRPAPAAADDDSGGGAAAQLITPQRRMHQS
jgi:hypothetical protein